ncbi:MAG: anthranilate phosphoribosyltransferase [Candidatus Omnitrophica bacterium]|nr:anthranilate phosphoribosyltransferase [Candidatus Omnitrophota bacterium]
MTKLTKGQNLSWSEMASAMAEIMDGNATPALISAFLVALKIKGETADEIAGAASVMREKALKIPVSTGKIIDTCGTGGDGMHTFNISTAVAITLSAYGVAVAKHGNRSVSSFVGSADIIEMLGLPLLKDPELVAKSIEDNGFGYIFAPYYHPAMKYAMPVRKELGIRTIFNILGPLANPANPSYQVIGVYQEEILDIMADALKLLNLNSTLVVYSEDGLDEISISASTKVRLVKNGGVDHNFREIRPEDFNIKKTDLGTLKVNNIEESMHKINKVFSGIESPELDIVALNSAFALVVLGEIKTPLDGFKKIKDFLKSGAELNKISQLKSYYKDVNPE